MPSPPIRRAHSQCPATEKPASIACKALVSHPHHKGLPTWFAPTVSWSPSRATAWGGWILSVTGPRLMKAGRPPGRPCPDRISPWRTARAMSISPTRTATRSSGSRRMALFTHTPARIPAGSMVKAQPLPRLCNSTFPTVFGSARTAPFMCWTRITGGCGGWIPTAS